MEVFVKVDGNILLMATLSVFRHPQYATELVFDKEFELLHTSKTSNVSFIGYKFKEGEGISFRFTFFNVSEEFQACL